MITLLRKKLNKKGFTLIELIVVIAVIGILAAIVIPRMGGFTDKAKQSKANTEARTIVTAYLALSAENPSRTFAATPTETELTDLKKMAGDFKGTLSGVVVDVNGVDLTYVLDGKTATVVDSQLTT